MKVLAPLFAFFALASAQNITIVSPTKGQLVTTGKIFNVQLNTTYNHVCFVSLFVVYYFLSYPNWIIPSSTHSQTYKIPRTAITIGIVPCLESDGCPDPAVSLGVVLYTGSYTCSHIPTSSIIQDDGITCSVGFPVEIEPNVLNNGSYLLTVSYLPSGVSRLSLALSVNHAACWLPPLSLRVMGQVLVSKFKLGHPERPSPLNSSNRIWGKQVLKYWSVVQ